MPGTSVCTHTRHSLIVSDRQALSGATNSESLEVPPHVCNISLHSTSLFVYPSHLNLPPRPPECRPNLLSTCRCPNDPAPFTDQEPPTLAAADVVAGQGLQAVAATAATVAANAAAVADLPVSKYPKHWGAPPSMQSRDYRKLPGGYGMGSGKAK